MHSSRSPDMRYVSRKMKRMQRVNEVHIWSIILGEARLNYLSSPDINAYFSLFNEPDINQHFP